MCVKEPERENLWPCACQAVFRRKIDMYFWLILSFITKDQYFRIPASCKSQTCSRTARFSLLHCFTDVTAFQQCGVRGRVLPTGIVASFSLHSAALPCLILVIACLALIISTCFFLPTRNFVRLIPLRPFISVFCFCNRCEYFHPLLSKFSEIRIERKN